MPTRVARTARFIADLNRLLEEADALGMADVAIDLDHAYARLNGTAGCTVASRQFALMTAGVR